jgi:hypothetical protein
MQDSRRAVQDLNPGLPERQGHVEGVSQSVRLSQHGQEPDAE